MTFIPLRPESIIPSQETVMSHGAEVQRYMNEGRIDLARVALDNMIKAGTRIDYEAAGKADSAAFDQMEELEAHLTSLSAERNRLEAWILRQHGVDVTNKPKVITKILTAQKRIEDIEGRGLPEAEASAGAFSPTYEETQDIAELTGHAWPYYPELSPLLPTLDLQKTEEFEDTPSGDTAIRMDIQNIISRLSYDRKGGLGLRYNTLVAYFFNEMDTETKSRYAKSLAKMIQNQEVRIWNEGSEDYIESLLVAESGTSAPEKKIKPIVLQMDINEAHTQEFIEAVLRQFGSSGYKRIERDETLEVQVPHAFAASYAKTRGMVLSKHGPSKYRFLSES